VRVLVSAWIGSTNLGDELVFRALVMRLRERGVSLTAVSIDPARTRREHGVDTVNHANLPGIWRELRQADRLVFGGGGLLQDETGYWNLPYQLSRVILARMAHTPFGLYGIGAGAIQTASGRFLVRNTLGPAVAASVRDAASARVLDELGISNPTVAADPAFSLPVPSAGATDRLVICLRPPLRRSRLLPASLASRNGVESEWIKAMARALDAAVDATGLQPHFVALQTDRDHQLHAAVADHMQAASTLVQPTVDTVFDEIATGRAVLAMRFHGGVAAAVARRPVVLLPYSPKVHHLADDLATGVEIVPQDPSSWSLIAEALQRTMRNPGDLDLRLERMRTRERDNATALDRLLAAT
jgi:polysaccharide pyruvyl transferase CsaB